MAGKNRITSTIIEKAKKVRLLIMDVDGVLTEGYIIVTDAGCETKAFDVRDGLGLVLWKRAGLNSAIITAGNTRALKKRSDDLKIDSLNQKVHDKLLIYEKLKTKFHLKDDEICFIGDDLVDVPVLKKSGLACCVPNASKDIIRYADYVCKNHGGRGAVREVIDLILKSKGLWRKVTNQYFKN